VNQSHGTQETSYEEFIGQLRSALHYLYDPVHLRRSTLVELLGHGSASDRAAALQRTLTDSIQGLKPSEDEPPQSSAWTVYDILNLHYLRQYERNVVASQLGISERQLRREQRLALEALAQSLWQKFQLEIIPAPVAPVEQATEKSADLSVELDWLKNSQVEELGMLREILLSVQMLVQPLAEQYSVTLHFHIDTLLGETPLPQASLRSILLTVLSAIIPRVENGAIDFSVLRAGAEMQLNISAKSSLANLSTVKTEINLEAAQQLAAFYGVALEVSYAPAELSARLCFGFPEQIPILVIDDNGDWLEMLKRYAVGTRYQVVTTRDSRSAAGLAEKIQPAVIFLDVMMPNVDGWQVLSELRQLHSTHRIPLVVCTVLPLADLALSLGVNVFLQKPITQEQFLRIIQELLNA
jgi:CheY-like chemotaxis protein